MVCATCLVRSNCVIYTCSYVRAIFGGVAGVAPGVGAAGLSFCCCCCCCCCKHSSTKVAYLSACFRHERELILVLVVVLLLLLLLLALVYPTRLSSRYTRRSSLSRNYFGHVGKKDEKRKKEGVGVT